jgi:hypothetical protein
VTGRTGANDTGRHDRLVMQPRQRNLGARDSPRGSKFSDRIDDVAVGVGCLY